MAFFGETLVGQKKALPSLNVSCVLFDKVAACLGNHRRCLGLFWKRNVGLRPKPWRIFGSSNSCNTQPETSRETVAARPMHPSPLRGDAALRAEAGRRERHPN